ncbi:MAG: hypothetical protein GF364_17045 [Candidatus Lokiarchaeota archaeon]|nr:hypothetical protein [Candidatus Lokiarchaeota archaeon]
MSEIERKLTEYDIEFISYQFTTIFGDLKSVAFPVELWEDLSTGQGVDGSSLGFLHTEQSDMIAVPDKKTFGIYPWEPNVAHFICDMVDNAYNPHPACPRGVLKRVIKQAKDMGFLYKTRPELEWYFVQKEDDGTYTPLDYGQYMDTHPFDPYSDLRFLIAAAMRDMHMGVKTIHHECGPCQHEIEFTVLDALYQADNVQRAKVIAKALSRFDDMICTFMPKPYIGEAGSGLHVHQYLTDLDGNNIFADKENGISDILRYFIGGILKHVNEMTAVINPITNSYKRLVPGHEAPVYTAWGVANRTALIRVPGYEKKARIEYRAGDGAMNIYLASALLLAAGLDGIKKKIEPIEPTTRNIETLTYDERQKMRIRSLPGSLTAALDLMEEGGFVKEVLGDNIYDIFLAKKREECKIADTKHAESQDIGLLWEHEYYLERV